MCTTKPQMQNEGARSDKGMKTDDGPCITMMYLFFGVSALFLSLQKRKTHTKTFHVMILKCQSSLFVLGLTQELTVKHRRTLNFIELCQSQCR